MKLIFDFTELVTWGVFSARISLRLGLWSIRGGGGGGGGGGGRTPRAVVAPRGRTSHHSCSRNTHLVQNVPDTSDWHKIRAFGSFFSALSVKMSRTLGRARRSWKPRVVVVSQKEAEAARHSCSPAFAASPRHFYLFIWKRQTQIHRMTQIHRKTQIHEYSSDTKQSDKPLAVVVETKSLLLLQYVYLFILQGYWWTEMNAKFQCKCNLCRYFCNTDAHPGSDHGLQNLSVNKMQLQKQK